jgi:hypothetical protein
LVDTPALGAGEVTLVEVQVLSAVPIKITQIFPGLFLFDIGTDLKPKVSQIELYETLALSSPR